MLCCWTVKRKKSGVSKQHVPVLDRRYGARAAGGAGDVIEKQRSSGQVMPAQCPRRRCAPDRPYRAEGGMWRDVTNREEHTAGRHGVLALRAWRRALAAALATQDENAPGNIAMRPVVFERRHLLATLTAALGGEGQNLILLMLSRMLLRTHARRRAGDSTIVHRCCCASITCSKKKTNRIHLAVAFLGYCFTDALQNAVVRRSLLPDRKLIYRESILSPSLPDPATSGRPTGGFGLVMCGIAASIVMVQAFFCALKSAGFDLAIVGLSPVLVLPMLLLSCRVPDGGAARPAARPGRGVTCRVGARRPSTSTEALSSPPRAAFLSGVGLAPLLSCRSA